MSGDIRSLRKTCCLIRRPLVNVTRARTASILSVLNEKDSRPTKLQTSTRLSVSCCGRSSIRHRLLKPFAAKACRRKSKSSWISSSRPNVESSSKYGLIAGNGRFPFLVLQAARSQGIEMVVAAIKEETFPEIEKHAATVHWMSLGQLGKLIKTFKAEGVTRAIMAGQVKHKQIFSSIIPDLKMIQLLASLATKNTDSLIGGVAKLLENEGIQLMDSTSFLRPLLPEPGVLTRRSPTEDEKHDLDYGYKIARELGRLDLGQSVAICEGACVALEAMEGTDAVIKRGASLVSGRMLRIVKLAKPNQDLRFDVPVIGRATVQLMTRLNVSALAIEARKTLMIDREDLIRDADAGGITIVAVE